MCDAQAWLVGEPLWQVVPDARVEPHFAGIGECNDCRGCELLRDRAEREYRGCIRRRPSSSDRAVTLLQDHPLPRRIVTCAAGMPSCAMNARTAASALATSGEAVAGWATQTPSRAERAIAALTQPPSGSDTGARSIVPSPIGRLREGAGGMARCAVSNSALVNADFTGVGHEALLSFHGLGQAVLTRATSMLGMVRGTQR